MAAGVLARGAVVCTVVLLICSVVYILTSPIKFAGILGDFQNQYAYLVAPTDSATGGAPRRRAIAEEALSLVGRVPYQYWHSEAIDDSELDLSDLVFKNNPDDKIINHVGISLNDIAYRVRIFLLQLRYS